MGLLDMFDKKQCCICGGEIGLLGNRKLEDGNLCKECAKKLSPLMTDRRGSTVEEIRQHLAYRERNKQVLASLHPNTVLGSYTKVYIDEAARKFFVTNVANWRDKNIDVIDLSQVMDVRTEVTEHRTEQYHRDREGRSVSFNPPRYRFTYEFTTTILVDSPFFNQFRFELTQDRPESPRSPEYHYYEQMADALHDALMPPKAAQQTLAQTLSSIAQAVTSAQAAQAAQAAQMAQNAAQFAASGPWTCACGALNEGNFCPQCGAKRPEPAKVFRCDKCGWTPDDPTNPPRFCPNCGDPFNAADAR